MRDFQQAVGRLVEAILGARYLVVLSGAGISTESGIPDFRSPGSGLWERFDPGQVLSAEAFWSDPARFYLLALQSWLPPLLQARPNAAHRALARLEAMGWVRAIITQNIDGLHQQAGGRRVIEIHGQAREARCTGCGRSYPLTDVVERLRREGGRAAFCPCGSPVKPGVVLFGEPMPVSFHEAVAEASRADLLVVVGSSLSVEPAASLPSLAGAFVINNLTPTGVDARALLVLPYPAGQVWSRVLQELERPGPASSGLAAPFQLSAP